MNKVQTIYFFRSIKPRICVSNIRAVAIIIASISVALVGCSVQPTAVIPVTTSGESSMKQEVKPSQPQQREPEAYEPSARTNTAYLSPAAQELVEKAKRYSNSGDSASALRYLERAQRISPRAPQVYLAMAEVRLQQGDSRQARQLANKALSLVGDDDDLRQTTELFLDEL